MRVENRLLVGITSKNRANFTKQAIKSVDIPEVDIVWVDNSNEPDALALCDAPNIENANLNNVYKNINGILAATSICLCEALTGGYEWVCILENDVVMKPGWLDALVTTIESAKADGLRVGAATCRTIASRCMLVTPSYALMWNTGLGNIVLHRDSIPIIIDHLHDVNLASNMSNNVRAMIGVGLEDCWEIWRGYTDLVLTADWHYNLELYNKGYVTVGTIPYKAYNIDVDLTEYTQSPWITKEHAVTLDDNRKLANLRTYLQHR